MANPNKIFTQAFIRKIILADGSEWNGSVVLASDSGVIFITLDEGYSFAETFAVFNDPSKTSLIKTTLESSINPIYEQNEYRNFTVLTDIKLLGGEIQIRLQHSASLIPKEDISNGS